jgi:beta-glucuronidase
MPKLRLRLLLLAVAACALAAPAPALAQQDGVERGALYRSGPDTRHLLGGEWLFRLDPGDRGLRERLQRVTSRDGWAPVTVPNAWNATDESDESMAGSIGWYRKDFRLPSRASRLSWVVRFESVNYRAQV